MILDSVIVSAPDNFVIRDALARCFEVVQEHRHIVCSCSGGGDSDVMVDLLLRCGAGNKTDFVFFNTGLEYAATFELLEEIERKYGISIHRVSAIKPIPVCVKEYGVPFWSKFASDMIHRLQSHNFQWEDDILDTELKNWYNGTAYGVQRL